MKPTPRIWIAIGAYVAAIYLTLPLMRPALNFLYSSLGRETLSDIVNALLLTAAGLLFFLLWRRVHLRSLLPAVLPLVPALAFIFLMERPEERVHFLEYGVLGFLVLQATGRRMALSLAFVILVGVADEFIQLLLPNRVGDLRDVVMNGAGGAFGLWARRFWH
jgi:hypothetical protein